MADKPNYITLAHLRTAMSALLNKIDAKPDEEDFANVAFSGDYSDLTNKPDLSDYVNWTTYSELADYASSVASINGILKGDGSGNITAATAGTDYQTPLPSQSGNASKFLTNDGSGNLSWSVGTWNGVSLDKTGMSSGSTGYIPERSSTSSITAYQRKINMTPEAASIAVYDANAYLNSTTPAANDNSTKVATTAFVKSKVESLGTVLNCKGTKATAAALPSSGNTAGDVWIVTEDNSEHVWNGSAWEEFGPTIDLSGYMEKGIDYVTAGQKSGTTLEEKATAEGDNTTASGYASHAEGGDTIASANFSHAEGIETTASGYVSHAEGGYTTASGEFSHAEGHSTTASGHVSHAEGAYTVAQRKLQHVFGEYNILDTTGSSVSAKGSYIEIVGNGTATDARSNARTLDWSGNETLAGKLTLGAGPTANMDAATKQYVDTAIGNAASITMVDHSGPTTTQLNSLTINKLTQAQYNAISTPDPNQLYFITDDTIYAEKSYVDNLFANVDALPSQSGNSGKFLTTNGSVASWANVDALPSQTGNSGKYLTTNGTTASWSTLDLSTSVKVYSRADIGTSPNFDNPGVNGLFEVRNSSETTGETGTKPFNSYGPILNLKTPDNIAMLQLAGANGTGFFIRGKQEANVTMASQAWQRLVTNSGTWAISITGSSASCTGNAATATTASSCSGNAATVSRATFGDSSNGTHDANAMTSNGLYYYTSNGPATSIGASTTDGAIYCQAYSTSWVGQIAQDYRDGDLFIRGKNNGTWQSWKRVWVTGDAVTGAVWNDYAEYRETDIEEFGRCVIENGDDTMSLSTKRLQKGCSITSDTWGFAQGQTEKAKTPIAVSGRVLAYPLENKEEFKKHIGDAVCSGPEGTVSIMTDEEVQKYPLSVIGTISAVPDYEEWGGGSDRDPVKVNGRVWIRIK